MYPEKKQSNKKFDVERSECLSANQTNKVVIPRSGQLGFLSSNFLFCSILF